LSLVYLSQLPGVTGLSAQLEQAGLALRPVLPINC